MKTIFDATMRLSEHFTLGEMCYSATAEAKKIPNPEAAHHSDAEPMQALSGAPVLPAGTAHQGEQWLPLPAAQPDGGRCAHVAAPEG